MLMRLAETPLLLEDDSPAVMGVRIIRIAIQDAGQQIQCLVKVTGRGFRPRLLGLLGLDSARR